MTVIDWFTSPGVDPKTLPDLIQNAIPGLKLYVPLGATLPFTINGFVNTSLRADGSVYVSVCLFSQAYTDNPDVPIAAAPNINPGQINQMVQACGGENPGSNRKINGGNPSEKAKDRANLLNAGFSDRDAPLKDT